MGYLSPPATGNMARQGPSGLSSFGILVSSETCFAKAPNRGNAPENRRSSRHPRQCLSRADFEKPSMQSSHATFRTPPVSSTRIRHQTDAGYWTGDCGLDIRGCARLTEKFICFFTVHRRSTLKEFSPSPRSVRPPSCSDMERHSRGHGASNGLSVSHHRIGHKRIS